METNIKEFFNQSSWERHEFRSNLKRLNITQLINVKNEYVRRRLELEDKMVADVRSGDPNKVISFSEFVLAKRVILERVEDIESVISGLDGSPEYIAMVKNEEGKRLLSIAQEKIKVLSKKNKYKTIPERHELLTMADKCRMKNGKINFSRLGKQIGHSNHTARDWCKHYNIV